jgi:hypothetical protein
MFQAVSLLWRTEESPHIQGRALAQAYREPKNNPIYLGGGEASKKVGIPFD